MRTFIFFVKKLIGLITKVISDNYYSILFSRAGYGIPVAQAPQIGSRTGPSPPGGRGGAPGRSYLSFSPQGMSYII